jgi:hypothetical protein
MIIAAFAGTGKTTLAKNRNEEFLDFVCMPYKYDLSETSDTGEAGKANLDNPVNPGWPRNYVEAIVSIMDCGKHILIPSDSWTRLYLRVRGIPYTLCYPKTEAKEEYRRRYIERGNTDDFLKIFIGNWDKFMDDLTSDNYGQHIVMEPSAYLSDIF